MISVKTPPYTTRIKHKTTKLGGILRGGGGGVHLRILEICDKFRVLDNKKNGVLKAPRRVLRVNRRGKNMAYV